MDERGPDDGRSDRRGPAPTTRLAGRDRGPGAILAAIVLFFAIAWIKPWPAPPIPLAPLPAPPTAAPPTPTADPLSDLKHHCQEPPGWRVYAHERWGGRSLRSWRSLEPAQAASGPLDPTIPIVPLGAAITSLGYCSPWNTDERPPAGAEVFAWRLEPRAGASATVIATAVPLRSLAPTRATVVAALYAPPAAAAPARSSPPVDGWAAGRWAFAVRAPGYERWWAIQIEVPPIPSGDLRIGAADPAGPADTGSATSP
jgi:hypothetical protein